MLVQRVFGKNEVPYANIANDFYNAASAERTTSGIVHNPWASSVTSTKNHEDTHKQPTETPSVSGIFKYTAKGDAEGLFEQSLATRGFEVDGFVKDKKGIAG